MHISVPVHLNTLCIHVHTLYIHTLICARICLKPHVTSVQLTLLWWYEIWVFHVPIIYVTESDQMAHIVRHSEIKFPSLPHNNTILPVSHTQKEEEMQLITFIKFHSQGFISLLRFKRNFPWLIFSYSNSYVGVKLHHLVGILPNISKPTLNFQTI